MAGYLLDTSVLIALVDPDHVFHVTATLAIDAMTRSDLQFVSVVSIGEIRTGEIRTGVASVQRVHGRTPTRATQVLAEAQARSPLQINNHVANAYGELKAAMVSKFMPKASKSKSPAHLEDWISHATGKRLGVNENDLWICAQGFERGLIVMTCDTDFLRIQEAEPRLALRLLRAV